MKHQSESEEEAFEEFCREIVHAARAEDEVVNAAADSAFLYQRTRSRMESEPKRLAKSWFGAWLFGELLTARLALAVTAVVAVATIIALPRWLRETPPPGNSSVAVKSNESAPKHDELEIVQDAAQSQTIRPQVAIKRHKPTALQRRTRDGTEEEELASEYLPLTYASLADEAESGHVVRVQLQRAALLALGVPISADTPDEVIKADVIVGDDGLARAIRLVR